MHHVSLEMSADSVYSVKGKVCSLSKLPFTEL